MIDREPRMAVPAWAMEETLVVLRELRADHQRRGGTSKLTRRGVVLTLLVEGPVDAVLDTAATFAQLRRKLEHVERLRAFADRLQAAVAALGER